ncbi:MAG TPA: UDP-glucose/GDP-mannose dehydrogenase family protein [Actinophytocola sp.]|uniref:UDP-glucose dehydrogenase family protein n=1 Tax=Actinophytocola sp. TaxID=1872138 RepID=UPI002DDD6C2A|nr:UDP-glucose/GDP-mannose dehydrogenase family protein [Actinophytocola sp.]HEV2780474.1 UDP-glucose/GDP-mannose dehydrogenase family protein [Actinophytocola sp.]
MFTRRVAVIGAGYVGASTAACLASLGHLVTCADINEDKVARLNRAEVSINEPGLSGLIAEGLAAGRLRFVVDAGVAVHSADVVYLCLPTPMGTGGVADLTVLESVLLGLREVLPANCIVAIKSTVPVGTAARSRDLLGRADVAVVSNPEFLREGSAVHDVLNPDRIVVGSDQQDAAERVGALYTRLGAPTVLTDAASAELIKYAANCFLATKLSYVNAIAELCERLGADVRDVTEGMGYDRRIGQAFLSPGPGWGGSCLPKDSHALLQIADGVDFEFRLLRAAIDTNTRQFRRITNKIRLALTGCRQGSLRDVRLCLFGLTFKAGTDDLRDSPALAVATQLRQAGAVLVAHDPAIRSDATHPALADLTTVDDPMIAAKGAEAVVVLTDWPQFRGLDWTSLADALHRPIMVDTRNLLDPDTITRAGLHYHGLGTRPVPPGTGVSEHSAVSTGPHHGLGTVTPCC